VLKNIYEIIFIFICKSYIYALLNVKIISDVLGGLKSLFF